MSEYSSPGLRATSASPLPYLSGVVVRSFLLERADGDVVIYNSPGIADVVRGRETPSRLLMNHWHEAMYGPPELDIPVYVHERDRAHTERSLPVTGVFTSRHRLGDDLEIIPTPGHTAGATMFLWDSGAHRLLFPGDSLWVHEGRWEAVVLGDSDREAYLESLTLIRDLDFDVLVPWGAEEGGPLVHAVGRDEIRERVGAIMARVAGGANH